MQLLQASFVELAASVEELRQMVAHQRESDTEKLQDQMEVLFSAWSEVLKEELQQKLEKVNQHAEGELMAVDIKMQHLKELAAKLSTGISSIAAINTTLSTVQVSTFSLAVNLLPCTSPSLVTAKASRYQSHQNASSNILEAP